jgi:urate oxidase
VPAELASSSYGKASIRLLRLDRSAAPHALADLTVDVRLAGGFDAAWRAGDNASLLPTDSMKNAAYALARTGPVRPLERFAERLARHLLAACPAARRAEVSASEQRWEALGEGPHAFARGSAERRIACVVAAADGLRLEAGIEGLGLLRSAGSAFRGFLRDRFTTLAETDDRLLVTELGARWCYAAPPADPDAAFGAVRSALLARFAGHPSPSLQHTLYAMGEAALAACQDVASIRLVLPNLHHDAADLSPLGLDNPNVVFVPSQEPRGVIEAEIARARAEREPGIR